MSDLRSSFRYCLPHRFWPSASETGIVPTRHEQHQRSARQREQVQLRTLLGSIRSGPRPKEAPAPVAVEGWRNFPGLPVGPRLEQREAKVREPSMREAAQQLSFGWRSRYHQDPISAPKRPQSANQKAPSTSRFAKMFDPKQLPADFRQQLCNLPRPIAARAFKHHLCITGVEGELSEDLGEAPQTPPNTPSHVEPPEAVRRSGKKRPSEGKPEGSPSASPSWIQRHMRIPSLTSEISEASAVETRRSSTVMQEEEIPGYLVEMQEEEIPGYLVEMQEEEIPGGEESSSSAADADASPSGPSAFAAAAETSEYEVLQRHQAPPKVHWLEQQELRIRQQLRHSCFDWSERMERMPRQAGGMVTRNWLNRNRKTAGPQWG